MAANGGGGPPFKKENEEILNDDHALENKGISIAERRAAKCGFNEARFRTTGLVPPARSPYFTVPPGISPSALLDSPLMLPNAQAQLSPTTGTFQFPSPNPESLKLKRIRESNLPTDHPSSNNFKVENKPFEEFEYQNLQEVTKKDYLEDALAKNDGLGSKLLLPNNTTSTATTTHARNQMLSHNDHSGKEKHPKEIAKYSEDGYYWRKYGQKHVKGSEFPRSYYKCTNTNCLVKKKVERSHDGQITEIVYKGSHNHPKPQPFKRFGDHLSEISEGSGTCTIKPEPGKNVAFSSNWRPDNGLDVASSTPFLNDFSNPLSRTLNTFEPTAVESQEFSSAFNHQDGNNAQGEASPESISINDEDDENGECQPKKRKRDSFPNETTNPRSTREPRVVVQIESEIDILDDGYRWRKYGQKVVKGNPNPRSYYKCTTPGCPVRKHVERAANDIKSVVTTYEGKHNHEVPSSKTGSLVISDVANLPAAVTNNTVSKSMSHKQDHLPKAGKHVQDLPLYMERKPIMNYNELMRSNLPGNFTTDFNFGTSSLYPLSFPPFHSLPYGSLMMNGNHMKTYPSSNLYPMLPDYLSLPSPINHVTGSSNVPAGAGNFHFNNYATLQNSTRGPESRECHSKITKPKEETRDDIDMYDGCLSTSNHGNGTI